MVKTTCTQSFLIDEDSIKTAHSQAYSSRWFTFSEKSWTWSLSCFSEIFFYLVPTTIFTSICQFSIASRFFPILVYVFRLLLFTVSLTSFSCLVPPKIVRSPAPTLKMVEGDTLQISCAAEGYPNPVINWLMKPTNRSLPYTPLGFGWNMNGFILARTHLSEIHASKSADAGRVASPNSHFYKL